jgi:HSP20 family protein
MSLLTSFDPFFRDLDRFTEGTFGRRPQTPRTMRMDAYRSGDHFEVSFDMPGVDPDSVEVTVEKNVLSVAAERHWSPQEGDRVLIAERPQGRFERKLYLSDNLDTDRIEAHYDRGVLTLQIPMAEASKARKVQVTSGEPAAVLSGTSQN